MSLNKEEEIFKPLLFCKEYEIGTFGNVRNNKLSILKTHVQNRGYKHIKISSKNYLIHRLVAITHVPNPDPEHLNVVDHIDRNPHNNDFKNLRWVNQSLNSRNRTKCNSNTGHLGICKRKNGKFEVQYSSVKYKTHKKQFDNLSDAIEWRNEKAKLNNYYITVCEP